MGWRDAEWLTELIVLREDLSLILCTHLVIGNHLTPDSGEPTPSEFFGHMTYIYASKIK